MTKPVIQIEGLSKAFALYKNPAEVIYELLLRRKRHDVFWALRDISLSVNEGDRIGIIGANGAGKSTLLKIITGNLMPTAGNVTVNGSISSMLSLTSYLNEQETGVENIKFNLAVMGVDEARIPQLCEEIIDFTELGTFIHSPVHTYSSGMNARLAFGISTALTPDILIVDEVLGVGDGYFVGKATQRMMDLCRRGRALLYVSHSLSSLQMLCEKAVWLDKGAVRMTGPASEVVKAYEDDFRHHEDALTRSANRRRYDTLRRQPQVDDVEDDGCWRVRLRPASGGRFNDVYYVGRVHGFVAGHAFEVSLEVEPAGRSRLDVMGSEWGRYAEHDGRSCRILTSATGKRAGGHILIRRPVAVTSVAPLNLQVEYTSLSGFESLVLEYLDDRLGEWRPCPQAGGEAGMEGWVHLQASAELPLATPEERGQAKAAIESAVRPDVFIKGVKVVVAGAETVTLGEREPFSIEVEAEVVRPVEALDIGLRIIRSDGVYAFWQSSGQTSGNITAEPGCVRATFDFTENLLAAGKYQVTVYAANGWDLESNYPYSEVYDRQINILEFQIRREFEFLDFGLLNARIPTKITIES